MNKRQKKKKIGYWAFVKLVEHDWAIYSVCQSCGFSENCSEFEALDSLKMRLTKPYNFCPNCGRRMKLWNGQHIYNHEGKLIK